MLIKSRMSLSRVRTLPFVVCNHYTLFSWASCHHGPFPYSVRLARDQVGMLSGPRSEPGVIAGAAHLHAPHSRAVVVQVAPLAVVLSVCFPKGLMAIPRATMRILKKNEGRRRPRRSAPVVKCRKFRPPTRLSRNQKNRPVHQKCERLIAVTGLEHHELLSLTGTLGKSLVYRRPPIPLLHRHKMRKTHGRLHTTYDYSYDM
jgi:hypothetical protein